MSKFHTFFKTNSAQSISLTIFLKKKNKNLEINNIGILKNYIFNLEFIKSL
jgi:hypothetical protein